MALKYGKNLQWKRLNGIIKYGVITQLKWWWSNMVSRERKLLVVQLLSPAAAPTLCGHREHCAHIIISSYIIIMADISSSIFTTLEPIHWLYLVVALLISVVLLLPTRKSSVRLIKIRKVKRSDIFRACFISQNTISPLSDVSTGLRREEQNSNVKTSDSSEKVVIEFILSVR